MKRRVHPLGSEETRQKTMSDVAIWVEMLALPVMFGFVAVVICLLKDERDFHRRHPHARHHGAD